MTPLDRWSDDRLNERFRDLSDRYEDLRGQVRTVASLTTLVATHDAKIDGAADDIAALRQLARDSTREYKEMLAGFDRTCEAKVSRLEKAIVEQGKTLDRKIDAQADKIEEHAKAREWSPAVKVALIGAVFGPLMGAIALVLQST